MTRIGIDCRKAADYGIGTYIRGLLAGLAELEPPEEFILFAPEDVFPLLPESPRFVRVAEPARGYSIRELFALGRHRVDLFHATHYVTPFTRAPVVVTIHDLIHLKVPTWRRHPLAPLYARWMMGRATRKSVRILTGTEAVRAEIEHRYPATRSRLVVTRFGVDAIFTAGPVAPERLSRYGLTAGRYLLFAGNDKPHKNLERLVLAYREFRQEGGTLSLALVGGTRRFDEPGIVRTGFVPGEDLPHLYRGAVALVQPSLEEGFGMPVVEAMACGTPGIIAEQPALREIAGEAAVVVDPYSIESIASAMHRLADDGAFREQLAGKGRQRTRLFSWKTCASQTLEAYRSAFR